MSPEKNIEASVQGRTVSPGGICEFATPGSLPALSLVIFGASGDLTARKLIPAFYSLYLTGSLPEKFTIVGTSRTVYSHEEFREKLKGDILKQGKHDLEGWEEFAAGIFYQPFLP